jgi:ribosomal protein S18 acetylase RimI-like enzyme
MTAASYNISHLARLAVLPNSQQHGLGSSLVQDTIREAEARGSTEISVNTQTNNASSLRLYSRFGFQQEGKLVPVFQKAVQEI